MEEERLFLERARVTAACWPPAAAAPSEQERRARLRLEAQRSAGARYRYTIHASALDRDAVAVPSRLVRRRVNRLYGRVATRADAKHQ